MGRRSDSSDSEYSKRSSRRRSRSRSSSRNRRRDRERSPDSKYGGKRKHRRSSSSVDSETSRSHRGSSRSGSKKSNSSRSRNIVSSKSHSGNRSSKYYHSSKRKSRSRDRDRERRRDERERDSRLKKKDRKRRRDRSSSTSSGTSSSNSSSSSENSEISNVKDKKDVGAVIPTSSKLSAANLLSRIEEKLDVTSQINRQQAINEIESEGFVQKSFKTAKVTKLEDIPMPSLDLKPINLTNLKNEVLCHPNLIINQREREEQWVKKLFSLRQRMFGSEVERIQTF